MHCRHPLEASEVVASTPPHAHPDAMTASPRAGLLKVVGIVGLSFLVALLVAELLLRLFGLAPTERHATVNEPDFERIPGIFAPDQELAVRQIKALPYRVSIDSLAQRRPALQHQTLGAATGIRFVRDSSLP